MAFLGATTYPMLFLQSNGTRVTQNKWIYTEIIRYYQSIRVIRAPLY